MGIYGCLQYRSYRDTEINTEAYCFGKTQFTHSGTDLACTRSLGVKSQLGAVEDCEKKMKGGKGGGSVKFRDY